MLIQVKETGMGVHRFFYTLPVAALQHVIDLPKVGGLLMSLNGSDDPDLVVEVARRELLLHVIDSGFDTLLCIEIR